MSFVTLTERIKFIESVFGPVKVAKNGMNADVWCPFCAPVDKTKKKLSIRTDDDRCHCWTCGFKSRSLVSLIAKFGSRERLNEYVTKINPTAVKAVNCRSIHVDVDERRVELPKDFKLLATSDRSDPDANAVLNYVTVRRKLSTNDIWFNKIGTSDQPRWRRRAIVPSFDSRGDLNYFIARTIDDRTKPRYDNPDADKLSIVFNEINVDWTRRLVVCEGVFDMFNCGGNVVPLLGSDMNEESALFNTILVHNTPIALALDGNMWETKTLKAAKKLASYNIDVVLVDTRAFEDPGSMTKREFKQALEAAQPFDWTSSFSTRLTRASRTTLRMGR